MKHLALIFALTIGILVCNGRCDAQGAEQAVPVDQAPEMSHLPWVLLFVPDHPDPLSDKVVSWFESHPALSAVQERSRFHVLPASHSRTPGYEPYHMNSFPAIVVAAPEPETRADIWACMRRAGIEVASSTPENLLEQLNLQVQESLKGTEDEVVGRPALFPRFWNDPPYPARPWLWGRNIDWDGSSSWFGSGNCTPADNRPPRPSPTPPPRPYVQPYPPQPYQSPFPDTALTSAVRERELKIEKLQERIEELSGGVKDAAGGLLGGLSLLTGASELPAALVAGVFALIAGLVGVKAWRRFQSESDHEDDE